VAQQPVRFHTFPQIFPPSRRPRLIARLDSFARSAPFPVRDRRQGLSDSATLASIPVDDAQPPTFCGTGFGPFLLGFFWGAFEPPPELALLMLDGPTKPKEESARPNPPVFFPRNSREEIFPPELGSPQTRLLCFDPRSGFGKPLHIQPLAPLRGPPFSPRYSKVALLPPSAEATHPTELSPHLKLVVLGRET